MLIEATYLLYLLISIAITVGVARSLSRNGRLFLVDGFGGNEPLADSVNHLLVVGFYLINLGFVCLALRFGQKPTDLQTAIEFLSTKLGLVMLLLGLMHLINIKAISTFRRRFRHDSERELDPRAVRPGRPDRQVGGGKFRGSLAETI